MIDNSNRTSDWVAYVGNIKFPEGSASSQRIFGVTKVIALCGFNVCVGAGSESEGKSVFVDNGYTYHGKKISFGITGDTLENIGSKLAKLKHLLFNAGKKTVDWLEQKESKPAAVIYYGVNASYVRRLRKWCDTNNIPFIVDVVEWYDPRHLGGHLSILNIENKYALKYLIPKSDGIIAISKYLENHFSRYNNNVVRVPIIDNAPVDIKRQSPKWDDQIKLTYAGDSGGGRKDLLNVIIEEVAQREKRFRLDIYGITERNLDQFEIYQRLPELRKAPNVKAHGRVSRELVVEALKQSHFIPLLRENKKYAQAGFPTKMVEAMGLGVPLIANVTGDIGDFVVHSDTGWLVKEPDEFGSALDAIANLNENEYLQLSANAKNKMDSLKPEVFQPAMTKFLKNIGL